MLVLFSAARAEPPKRIEIDFASPKIDNEFCRLNPSYKERAGSFYEREYLPGTAEYLFEVCSIESRHHPYVMEILRAFIYEWCDAYMRGNGSVSAEAVAPIVNRMEQRILALLDEGQKERYPAWRNTRTGKNSMKFLMDRPAAKPKNEQDGADQPATDPGSKPENKERSNPDPEGRSR